MNAHQYFPQSITGLRTASTWGIKLIYLLYLLLGATLIVGALYTFLKSISYIGIQLPFYAFVILAGYTLVQGVFGYGLFYMRKWILPVSIFLFTTDLFALIVFKGTLFTADPATLVRLSIIASLILLFYFTRHQLTGRYKQLVPLGLYLIGYIVAAIFSLSYAFGTDALNNLF